MTATTTDEAMRNARVELAALYRLVDLQFGSGEGIYNHVSLRSPADPNRFLIKHHAALYGEVTASSLLETDLRADVGEGSGVNRPGFILHGAALAARPEIRCAIHIHGKAALAMSAHAGGLRMMTQNALRFYRRVGYHPYEGITEDLGERERIAAALGADNIALVLRNHGLLIVGGSPRDAFERTRDFMTACETQLMLEAAGAEIIDVPGAVCERVAVQYLAHDSGRGAADWPAWLRMLDRLDPSYRD